MREIKFRGKRKDNGEWVCGYLIKSYDERYFIGFLHNSTSLDGDEIIKESVVQFTGLLDKNGKEIFEGDIIISKGNPDVLFLISHGEDTDGICYGFILKSINLTKKDYPLNKEIEKYEVIGNKFENPELLEEEK